MDPSNGYDAIADRYMAARNPSHGVAIVRDWIRTLPERASVLDLGCGDGIPISKVLIEAGMDTYGIDASKKMVAAFRARFRDTPVICETVESSAFFDRQFDGIVACGLVFLLSEEGQRSLMRKVGRALRPGGRFLFTSPKQVCEWGDTMTGLVSRSLGSAGYESVLRQADLVVVKESIDEGGNNYFDAVKYNSP